MCMPLREEFNPKGYNIADKMLGKCMAKILALFIKDIKAMMVHWGRTYKLDDAASIKELGIKHTPHAESIVDMAYSLIEHGYVKKK